MDNDVKLNDEKITARTRAMFVCLCVNAASVIGNTITRMHLTDPVHTDKGWTRAEQLYIQNITECDHLY